MTNLKKIELDTTNIMNWMASLIHQRVERDESFREDLVKDIVSLLATDVEIDYSDLGSEIDYSDLSCEMSYDDIASEIDYGELADCLDAEQLAEQITVDTDEITRRVADTLDYDELASFVVAGHGLMQNKLFTEWLGTLCEERIVDALQRQAVSKANFKAMVHAELEEVKQKVWWRRALRSLRKVVGK